MSWPRYTAGDVGITLFDACLSAGAPMVFNPGAKVLEIGSCESDWLERAREAWPECEFAGIDVRADKKDRPYRWKRNALDVSIFPDETFDAIVSLSAIEHMGLGHYGDPLLDTGDIRTVANAWRWLKPGGWFYLDVPYDPTGYRVLGTKCRVYDDCALTERFAMRVCHANASAWLQAWVPGAWMGYVEHKAPGTLVPKPTQAVQPFHYVAMVLVKSPQTAN